MNILSIISSAKHTGPGVPALTQAQLLSEAGHKVTFACTEGGSLAKAAEKAGLNLEYGFKLPRNGEIWDFHQDVKHLKDLNTKFWFDLIIVHRSAEMITAGLALGGNTPLLRVWHDGSGRAPGRILNMLFKRFSIHVAATSLTGAKAVGEPARNQNGEYRVIPAAVDTTIFKPLDCGPEIRSELGFQEEEIVVGMVARWKKGRGHREFLQAFSTALKSNLKLRALLIGRGELEDEIKAIVSELGLAHAVKLINPGERFVQTLAACDCSALMVHGSDAQCRAGLEQMAMGIPMAVMNSGSLADLGGSETSPGALLCENQSGLTENLLRLTDEKLRHELSLRVREFISSYHTPTVVAEKINRLVNDLPK